MISDVMDPQCVIDRGPSTAPKSITTERASPLSLLSNQFCREILRLCPREWSSIYEIYGLRRTIMERLLRNADHLRWRLS